MTTTTAATAKAAMQAVLALAEAIRELGEVPSGHLYAAVMSTLSLADYEAALRILISGKLIEQDQSHLLRWIGPRLDQ